MRAWFARLRERRLHNDRDHACRYWWGDRGGYDLSAQRCPVCNPEDPNEAPLIRHPRIPQPSYDTTDYEMGDCFSNAMYAADDNGWRYVRGVAQCPEAPGEWTPHAWCEDAEGMVIDPTWPDTGPGFVYKECEVNEA